MEVIAIELSLITAILNDIKKHKMSLKAPVSVESEFVLVEGRLTNKICTLTAML